MRQLDIRFVKETNAKKANYQLETIAKLQERLPKKFGDKYSDVDVRIRFSSSPGTCMRKFVDNAMAIFHMAQHLLQSQ
ncbi:hypothetical protein A1D23_06035 [Chelonobacter oris]|uniref:DinI family protein n=1 Tax=Chelonobacter oris TaxID=505317 RepID=UPI002447CDCF|nr:DinI family protein [Chelonobacter oris]MDH2999652.1 hypothetical protein [Chelonobacter oris]